MSDHAKAVSIFNTLVAAFDDRVNVDVGKMLNAQSLRVNGKSFAYASKEALVFKLPKSDVAELVEREQGTRLVVGKRIMSEWVVVPATHHDLCTTLTEKAYRFVGKRQA